jgi:cell wall-associated NlpC family hydrolase
MTTLAKTFTRADIEREALSWIGVPFHHQGRSRHGVDCLGLIVCTAFPFMGKMDDRTDYPKLVMNSKVCDELSAQMVRIEEPSLGSILIFAFKENVGAQHAAWKTSKGMVHAYGTGRKVVEHAITPAWWRRLHSCWDLPGVLD